MNKLVFLKKYAGVTLFVCLLLCLPACNKPKTAQLPSNKPEVDSTALAMIEINQRLVEDANKTLTDYVLASGLPYVQDDFGFWYYISNKTEKPLLAKDDIVTMHQQIFSFDGIMCDDAIITAPIGQKQFLPVIEYTLLLLRIGESVEVLTPWYLAYGQKGNGTSIGAYANLRIKIDILDN